VTNERDALRRTIGRVGAWTFSFDGRTPESIAEGVRAIEAMGFPVLWIPEGGGSNDVLTNLGWGLASTQRLTMASGIANITARHPEVLARGAAFLQAAYPQRLVLGIGVGHEYTTERRAFDWAHPVERTREYLDAMTREDAFLPPRMLAALGDRMLRLAAERTAGAHTYFVPVDHTAHARGVLGPEPVLAVEVGVLPGLDDATARTTARAWARHYLELPNYANNWRRLGYDADPTGDDRLLEAAFAWGDPSVIAGRVREHLDAGADHVCVQILDDADADSDLTALAQVAPALLRL
jgi:probable F420-dependent oxidoreductase